MSLNALVHNSGNTVPEPIRRQRKISSDTPLSDDLSLDGETTPEVVSRGPVKFKLPQESTTPFKPDWDTTQKHAQIVKRLQMVKVSTSPLCLTKPL